MCDLHVHLPLQRELCQFNLAPLTSPALQMMFGDTLVAAIVQVCSSISHQASMTINLQDPIPSRLAELPVTRMEPIIPAAASDGASR